MPLKPFLLCPVFLLAAACGSPDRVTDPDVAANAVELNAAIAEAETEMEIAQNQGERLAEAEARGAALAERTMERADEANSDAAMNAVADVPPMQ